MRRLRLSKGLSQRALTKQLGLSAHSNIADYETGRRVPPRDIVIECQRLLDGDTLLPLHDAALADRATPSPSMPRPARRRLLALGVALAATVAALLSWLRLSAAPGADPPSVAPASVLPSIWDGNDPRAAGCAHDAISADAEPVRLGETQIGTVTLRYSPSCGAAWAKFEPLPQASPPAGAIVIVEAVRPADGMKTVFHYPGFEQVYGDLLLTGLGCVTAGATVTFADGTSAIGSTSCLAPSRAMGG